MTNDSKLVFAKLEKVDKTYSGSQVLKNLNLNLALHDRVLLLGANGAGKSTLIKILAQISTVDQGTVKIGDATYAYAGQDLGLYSALSVLENLEFFLEINSLRTDVNQLISAWGLRKWATQELSKLSKGIKQRVNLCRAFALNADFLILDEPTAFLSAEGVTVFKDQLTAKLNNQSLKGFLIASHDLQNLNDVVNRVMLLAEGQISVDKTTDFESIFNMYKKINR